MQNKRFILYHVGGELEIKTFEDGVSDEEIDKIAEGMALMMEMEKIEHGMGYTILVADFVKLV
jgi:hypothetical protein